MIDTPPSRPQFNPPPPPPRIEDAGAGLSVAEQPEAVVEREPRPARHIVGSFQFSVQVQTAEEILPIVERARTNIQRALHTIPIENRWHSVMRRYLTQMAAKVTGLGGRGDDGDRDDHEPHRLWLEGKVEGIRYDSLGEFSGFLLRTVERVHEFSTREPDLERLATRAWRERIALRVRVHADARHVPIEIVLLRVPHAD